MLTTRYPDANHFREGKAKGFPKASQRIIIIKKTTSNLY